MAKKTKLNISELVDKYTDDLFRYALYKLSDEEKAKDIVQDTFLAATEKAESFKGESNPKTWLFSILNFKIIDVYRSKSRHDQRIDEDFSDFFDKNGSWLKDKMPSDWSEDEHLLDNENFIQIMEECMDALPENWNLCMKLKYISGKKGSEICKEMDISETNYWQITRRSKLQLRECIEGNWFKN